MRISKSQIRARTRDLPITFSSERISAHGGLEIIWRFFQLLDFRGFVQDRMRHLGPEGDYGFVRMLTMLLGLLIVGGVRVTHLAFRERQSRLTPSYNDLGARLLYDCFRAEPELGAIFEWGRF